MNKEIMLTIPKGWVWTRLGEIVDIKYGKDLSVKEFTKEGYPVFGANGIIGFYTKYLYEDEQVMISCRGAYSGKINLSPPKSFITHNSLVLEISEQFKEIKKFLFYILQSADKSKLITGTAQPQVTINNAIVLGIPLPPLPEQHCIVAKIEELFNKLDAGIKALKKIKKQLKCYRQSVLKYSFEGKLTEEWREKHLPSQAGKGELEPASLLFRDKIKDIYKTHRKNLPSVNDLQSNDLPTNWSYATLPYLVTNEKYSIKRGPFGSSIKKEYFVSSGYKVYEQQNVIKNDFKLGKYYINEEKFQEMKAFAIKTGDILISCSGTIGRIVVVPESYKKGIINQALLKLTLDNNVILTKFFVYLFRYFVKEKEFYANIKGVAIKNIASVKELKKILFKLPPFLEQQKILEEIEHHFSIADEIEKVVDKSLQQSKQLRQSILKKAFKGKLVPQWPDLPAPQPGLSAKTQVGKYWIYVIKCSNDSNYIGQTYNLRKRWEEHLSGEGSEWTKRYPPQYIMYWKEFSSREEAIAKEKWLKTGFGRKWIKREEKAGRLWHAGEPAEKLLERITCLRAKMHRQKAEKVKNSQKNFLKKRRNFPSPRRRRVRDEVKN